MTDARRISRLRAAIVGPGLIARLHAEAIHRVGATVRVVVGRTETTAAAARDALGAERATADLSLILADSDIDIVHICTPNVHHYSMARSALEAGKHVVLEKPLTIGVAEGRDLVRRAEASQRVHAMCFNTRFYPLVQEIHARVQRGDLGQVLAVRASVLEDGLLLLSDWNWRLDPSVGGPSVALSTVGCHLIDLVTFMVGEPAAEVCADIRTVHARRRPPSGEHVEVNSQEIAHLLVRFPSGCRGVFSVSQASAGRRYDYTVELDGTRQALAWRAPDSNELWVGHRDAPNQIVLRDPQLLTDRASAYAGYGAGFREGFAETFKQLVAHVYEAIASGDRPPLHGAAYPTFHDGLAALNVHAAALASSQSGHWEEVAYNGA